MCSLSHNLIVLFTGLHADRNVRLRVTTISVPRVPVLKSKRRRNAVRTSDRLILSCRSRSIALVIRVSYLLVPHCCYDVDGPDVALVTEHRPTRRAWCRGRLRRGDISQTETGSAAEPKVRGEASGAEAMSAPRDHILHILQADVAAKMLHLLRLLVACPQVVVKLLVATSQPLHLLFLFLYLLALGFEPPLQSCDCYVSLVGIRHMLASDPLKLQNLVLQGIFQLADEGLQSCKLGFGRGGGVQ